MGACMCIFRTVYSRLPIRYSCFVAVCIEGKEVACKLVKECMRTGGFPLGNFYDDSRFVKADLHCNHFVYNT